MIAPYLSMQGKQPFDQNKSGQLIGSKVILLHLWIKSKNKKNTSRYNMIVLLFLVLHRSLKIQTLLMQGLVLILLSFIPSVTTNITHDMMN